MDSYDNRRITLDPGLTLLALRGLQPRGPSYPFIERHARWRALTRATKARLATWFPTVLTLLAAHRGPRASRPSSRRRRTAGP
jgi:hypothetical protein